MKNIWVVTRLGDFGPKATCIYVLISELDLIKNITYMLETFLSTNFHLDYNMNLV